MKNNIAQITALPIESIKEIFASPIKREEIDFISDLELYAGNSGPWTGEKAFPDKENLVSFLIDILNEDEIEDARLTFEREVAA